MSEASEPKWRWDQSRPDGRSEYDTIMSLIGSPRLAAACALVNDTKARAFILHKLNVGDLLLDPRKPEGEVRFPIPDSILDETAGIRYDRRRKNWRVTLHWGYMKPPNVEKPREHLGLFDTKEDAIEAKREWRLRNLPYMVPLSWSVPYLRAWLRTHPWKDGVPEAPLFIRVGVRGHPIRYNLSDPESYRVNSKMLTYDLARAYRRFQAYKEAGLKGYDFPGTVDELYDMARGE